jgi:hypothetical protein
MWFCLDEAGSWELLSLGLPSAGETPWRRQGSWQTEGSGLRMLGCCRARQGHTGPCRPWRQMLIPPFIPEHTLERQSLGEGLLAHSTKANTKEHRTRAPVAHACNPGYSEGRDQEDHSLKPAQGNNSWDPILKWKTLQKNRAGGVAQGEGPEFKPQYCKKKKNHLMERAWDGASEDLGPTTGAITPWSCKFCSY